MDNWEIYNYIKAKNGGSSKDSATLNALIDRSITEIRNDEVKKIGNYAFNYCTNLVIADFPNCTSIGGYTFSNCNSLEKIVFPKLSIINNNSAFSNCSSLKITNFPNVSTVGASAFLNCVNLEKIIFKSNQVVTLNNSNAFASTPIANGTGYIYVPDDLVESYKNATNWSTYANQIKGLSELPE